MIDYIKKQINGQMGNNVTKPVEDVADVPNEAILEYAHIFQEFDDLSVKGTDAGRERKMVLDIPIEDDVELTTVEFNLDGGRVEDVPGDATAATIKEYTEMKTYESFYQEAYNSITRLPRESEASFASRAANVANKRYESYCEYATCKGLFGFDKIDLDDKRVPSKLNIDFGPIEPGSNKSFVTKVNTYFGTDEKHQITKKQLDSVNLVKDGAFTRIGEPLMAYMESNYDIPTGSSVWDVCTPKNLIVPKGNNDSFCVVLEYTNEITGKNEYFGWTQPTVFQEGLFGKNDDKKETLTDEKAKEFILKNVDNSSSIGEAFKRGNIDISLDSKSGEIKITSKEVGSVTIMSFNARIDGKTKKLRKAKIGNKWVVESVDMSKMISINMESFINEEQYENRDIYIQECAVEIERPKRPMPSRFFQEAMDFDGGSSEGDGGSDLPPVEGSGSDDTSSEPTSDSDTSVDTGNVSDAPESNDDSSDKEEATVNDVSEQIAEKVAAQTQQDVTDTNSSDDTSITFDDDGDSTSDIDTSETAGEGASVDDQLDDLDNSMGDDTSDDDMPMDDMSDTGDAGDIDIENMTIDQMIESGTEKLKGMTISQIKQFISSNDSETVQEAFIITKKNVNKELDVNLRKCLGILNDNQMNIEKLLRSFKIAGMKLNRVLVKAVKMKDIYSSDEQGSISKLNKILTDLMTSLKHSKDQSHVATIKRLVREFVAQSKIVGAFVEDKLNGPTSEAVQEGFVQEGFFLSEKNAKKRLANKIQPVFIDISSIVRAYKDGKLSKGKLSKMYKPKNASKRVTLGGDDDLLKFSKTRDVNINTPEMNNIDALEKVINKILRKKNVQTAFSSDELAKIEELYDIIDDFMDFVESIIYDNSGNESLLDLVGKDASKIVDILNGLYVSCTGEEPLKRNESDTVNSEGSTDDIVENTINTDDDVSDDIPNFDDDDIDDETTDIDGMNDSDSDTDNEEGKDDE